MSKRVARVHGFEVLDFDHPDPKSLPIMYDRDTLLIVRDGHAIGVRPYRGGRIIVAVPRDGGPDRAFTLQQLAFCSDDAIHTMLALDVDADVDLVESDDVPAPFDRFMIGGERLPDPAKA